MRLLRIFIVMIGLLLLWQAIIWLTQLPPFILPEPLTVIKTLWSKHAILAQQAIPTFIEALLGLLLGFIFGAFTAIILALYRPLRLWVWPLLLLSQAIPVFAIAPILVIWLGYGITSKVAIAVLVTYFPIATAFYDGLQRTPQIWLDLAHTMSASKWCLLRYVRLPAALPHFASGLRVATALAPIAALVGEWAGASQGLGVLMITSNARLQTAMTFAALLWIVAFSLLLYFIIDRCLKYWIRWR